MATSRLQQLLSHIEQQRTKQSNSSSSSSNITMTSVQQLFSLEGQTALVTGGTRGIGQAMAIALAEAGADIILVQVSDASDFALRNV
jgi:NADPH:quinone reductase-like Zn-dependent oxidoreductase